MTNAPACAVPQCVPDAGLLATPTPVCSFQLLLVSASYTHAMAQRISADAVIQFFAGEDPGSLSESVFDGSDDDLGMDWDSDNHQSESEQMHDGMFFCKPKTIRLKRFELVKIL